jgi:beta-galactosidase
MLRCLTLLALLMPPLEADMIGPDCRVQRVGGVPTFMIDGRPHSGICYSTYDCHLPRLHERVERFASAGCDIYNFVVEIAGYGYSRPMWVGPDEWDFRDLDDRARTVLQAAPNAWLLPRIYIDAPAWWCAANPGELLLLDDGSPSFGEKLFALSREGNYPSLASAKWRADMDRALVAVIDHIEASDYGPRVIGYQLSGQKTEEWYHWSMNCDRLGDYSPHVQQAYGAPVPSREARYGDRSRPFRDPVAEADVIAFHRFWSDLMAGTIEHFARTVKTRTSGRKLVGAFYAYTFEFTDLAEDAGHLACGRLERSPYVDFIMAPSSYYDRNLPGRPYFRAPVASLQAHGKVFWNDFDQVSYKYYDKLKADPNLKTWEYQMGLTQTPEEFVWMCRREVGMELAQGVQLAHFDIHGGYYDDEVIMEGVKQLIEVRREALQLPDRGSTAQILVLADEASEHCYSFRSPVLTRLLSHQLGELVCVAPYDTALLADLALLAVDRYRLVILPNAVKLDEGQRALIRRKLCRDGRTVLWLSAPGYFADGAGSLRNIERLTGVAVPEGAWLTDAEPTISPQSGWTSVYSPGPVSTRNVRSLARNAGVHLYTSDPHVAVFANRHYLTVCADRLGGPTTVRLPQRATVTDTATGAQLCADAARFEVDLRPKEVRLLRLLARHRPWRPSSQP